MKNEFVRKHVDILIFSFSLVNNVVMNLQLIRRLQITDYSAVQVIDDMRQHMMHSAL